MARLSHRADQTTASGRLAQEAQPSAEKQVPSQKPNARVVQRGDALGADSLSAQSHEPRPREG